MEAVKTFAEIEDTISDLVSGIVFVSPTVVVYEADTLAIAEACVARLHNFSAQVILKNDRWFVSVLL